MSITQCVFVCMYEYMSKKKNPILHLNFITIRISCFCLMKLGCLQNLSTTRDFPE